MKITAVGDALLDRDVEGRVDRLCPDAPVPVVDEESRRSRPGGAGLAAVLAASDGHEVTLITALGRDPAGKELAALLADAGVAVVDLGLDGTTTEKVRILTGGRSLLRLDRGHSGRIGTLTRAAAGALDGASAVLVADYGRGITGKEDVRSALSRCAYRAPVVWDPHPRGFDPVPGVRLATPNRSEAAGMVPEVAGEGLPAVAARARALVQRWRAEGVAVTMGAQGALLVGEDGEPLPIPAPGISGGDPCGAGDRFASRLAGLLAEGASPREAVAEAVHAASRFVAAGGAGSVGLAEGSERGCEPRSAEELAALVRGRGGTVVATGGCFDLLHAGHVRTLQAARALGDCLIVCLNSDESVRRLKGPDRPLVTEEERATVLRALGCVDAVATFHEDTPETILERLRPHVFAKGGDYAVPDLPEARVLSHWGGKAVILPYVEGRSTTRLIEQAGVRAGS